MELMDFLSIPLDPMAPPTPVIQASSSSVAVGDNLRVACSAVGERDVFIEFNWEYPGQQVRSALKTSHRFTLCMVEWQKKKIARYENVTFLQMMLLLVAKENICYHSNFTSK